MSEDYHRVRFKHLKPPPRKRKHRPERFWLRLRRRKPNQGPFTPGPRPLNPGHPTAAIVLPLVGGVAGFLIGSGLAFQLLRLADDYHGANASAYDSYALIGALLLGGVPLAIAGRVAGEHLSAL